MKINLNKIFIIFIFLLSGFLLIITIMSGPEIQEQVQENVTITINQTEDEVIGRRVDTIVDELDQDVEEPEEIIIYESKTGLFEKLVTCKNGTINLASINYPFLDTSLVIYSQHSNTNRNYLLIDFNIHENTPDFFYSYDTRSMLNRNNPVVVEYIFNLENLQISKKIGDSHSTFSMDNFFTKNNFIPELYLLKRILDKDMIDEELIQLKEIDSFSHNNFNYRNFKNLENYFNKQNYFSYIDFRRQMMPFCEAISCKEHQLQTVFDRIHDSKTASMYCKQTDLCADFFPKFKKEVKIIEEVIEENSTNNETTNIEIIEFLEYTPTSLEENNIDILTCHFCNNLNRNKGYETYPILLEKYHKICILGMENINNEIIEDVNLNNTSLENNNLQDLSYLKIIDDNLIDCSDIFSLNPIVIEELGDNFMQIDGINYNAFGFDVRERDFRNNGFIVVRREGPFYLYEDENNCNVLINSRNSVSLTDTNAYFFKIELFE